MCWKSTDWAMSSGDLKDHLDIKWVANFKPNHVVGCRFKNLPAQFPMYLKLPVWTPNQQYEHISMWNLCMEKPTKQTAQEIWNWSQIGGFALSEPFETPKLLTNQIGWSILNWRVDLGIWINVYHYQALLLPWSKTQAKMCTCAILGTKSMDVLIIIWLIETVSN